jgi:APA family basic amino acid/polyamine antiporter
MIADAASLTTLQHPPQGVGCIFSGLSFAELASRIPSAGSTYAYSYVTLGELFAFVAGW